MAVKGANKRYALRRPCENCPFRTDIPGYLRPERAREIAESIACGAEFPCHKTTVPDPDDDSLNVGAEHSQMCAGAMILMEHEQAPNQMLRVAERIGLYDAGKLDMDAPVARSFVEFIRHHGGDEEDQQTCEICNAGCEAPAGMLIQGHVITYDNSDVELYDCKSCGAMMCQSCSEGEEECPYCLEHADVG